MPETHRIAETTQARLSGCLVGVGNIFERDFDEGGAKVSRMSASLAIMEVATRSERREFVHDGSAVALGGERYRVVSVDPGTGELGSVTLEKVTP